MSVVIKKGLVAAVVASSMLVGSTGAMAAGTGSAAPQQVSPWAALTSLSAGAPAAALCGAAAAAAAANQAPAGGCVLPAADAPVAPVADAGPPPPLPAIAAPAAAGAFPLIAALGVLAVAALTYFLVRNHHGHTVSPA